MGLLLQRRRGRTPRPAHNNGLLSAGRNAQNGLGGGYLGGYFAHWQKIPVATRIVQVVTGGGKLMLDTRGVMSTFGTQGYGAQGFGAKGSLAGAILVPTPIVGGIPLYLEETFKEGGVTFVQPVGPNGPIVPPLAALAAGSETRYALTGVATGPYGPGGSIITVNKRLMAFGSNAGGALGNGWEQVSESVQKNWSGVEYPVGSGHHTAWKPQYAPFWVLKEGPQGEEALGGTNVLEGVKAVAAARQVFVALMENSDIYFGGSLARSGSTAKNGANYYAVFDTVWDAYRKANPGLAAPIGVACCSSNYTVLLADGTERVVGVVDVNREGMFGVPGGSFTVREVKTPEYEDTPGHFKALDEVIAIASGQYFCMSLRADGSVFVRGSNRDAQLGLGLAYQSNPEAGWYIAQRSQRIPQAAFDNLAVKAIAAGGKGEEIGTGETGGDNGLALLSDKTTRHWGKQYIQRVGTTLNGQGTGALGDGTSMTRSAPVNPGLAGIVGLDAGASTQTVIQEPGAPGTPSITVSYPGTGELLVEWAESRYPIGSLQHWRREEGWRLKLTAGPGPNHDSGPLAQSYNEVKPGTDTAEPGSLVHRYLFTGITTPGAYELAIIGTNVQEVLTIAGGTKQTASGGKLTLHISDPLKPEPGYYVEWHREPGLEKDVLKTVLTKEGHAGDLAIFVEKTAGLNLGDVIKIGGTATPGTGEYVEVQHVEKEAKEVELAEPLVEAHAVGQSVYEVKLTSDIFTRSALQGALPAASAKAWGEAVWGIAFWGGHVNTYNLTLEPSAHGLTNENLTLKATGSFEPSFKTRNVPVTIT